jgi:hypothetical protein
VNRVLAAAAMAIALSACAVPVPHVTQGEAVTTGQTSYDDFFLAVRELRAEALAAPNDEEGSHAVLIKTLGLDPQAKASAAVEESGKRAKQLVEKGVLLHLDVAPDARLLTARGKGDLSVELDTLLRALEGSARASLEMRKRFVAVAARAVELEKRRGELRAQAPDAFKDATAKRDEVIVELDAARAVLSEALEKAEHSAGAAARFVVDLAQALETGAADVKPSKGPAGKKAVLTIQPVSSTSPPAAVASAPTKPTAPAAAKPAAAKPAAAKPAPPAAKPAPAAAKPAKPAPAKKPKGGGDDFEP